MIPMVFLGWVSCDGERPPIDVPADAPFVRVRISTGGMCDPRGPCGSYRELWGEGTFRYRDNGRWSVGERSAPAEDVDAVAAIVQDEALLAMLDAGGCALPVLDASETTLIELADGTVSGPTLGCEEYGLVELRSTLSFLVPDFR